MAKLMVWVSLRLRFILVMEETRRDVSTIDVQSIYAW